MRKRRGSINRKHTSGSSKVSGFSSHNCSKKWPAYWEGSQDLSGVWRGGLLVGVGVFLGGVGVFAGVNWRDTDTGVFAGVDWRDTTDTGDLTGVLRGLPSTEVNFGVTAVPLVGCKKDRC